MLAAMAAMAPLLAAHAAEPPGDTRQRLAAIERASGGRLGVAAIDTGGGASLAYRADERFPMCSTFKLLLVAAVLNRVDGGAERLDREIAFGAAEIQRYAPVTKAHLSEGTMTVEALCATAIEWSDNTAANLLLRTLGGPAGITGYARSLGDPVTRLDRFEPALNEATPGDPRDTTSPAAMLRTFASFWSRPRWRRHRGGALRAG